MVTQHTPQGKKRAVQSPKSGPRWRSETQTPKRTPIRSSSSLSTMRGSQNSSPSPLVRTRNRNFRDSSLASSPVPIPQPLALQTASHRLEAAGYTVVPPSAGVTPTCSQHIKCAICHVTRDTAKRMFHHIKDEHAGMLNKFQCATCRKIFPSGKDFRAHFDTAVAPPAIAPAQPEVNIVAPVAIQPVQADPPVNAPVATTRNPPVQGGNSPVFHCNSGCKSYMNSKIVPFLEHRARCHGPEKKGTGPTYQCTTCKKDLVTKHALKIHLERDAPDHMRSHVIPATEVLGSASAPIEVDDVSVKAEPEE
jgi:hypothetical protein